MTERRYDDDEVAAIFERAAKNRHAAPTGPGEGTGLTIAALQDIGREVGISPEAIAKAAQSLDHGRPRPVRTFLGVPIGVAQSVDFAGPIADPEWECLVTDLRDTFGAHGTLRQQGSFRQWTNGNLRVLLEPTPGGHRLRMQSTNGNARLTMTLGVVFLAATAVELIAAAIAGGAENATAVAGIRLMAVAGAALFVVGALRVRPWARRRRVQFEAIGARLAGLLAQSRNKDRAVGPGQG